VSASPNRSASSIASRAALQNVAKSGGALFAMTRAALVSAVLLNRLHRTRTMDKELTSAISQSFRALQERKLEI
jgi:hypothetical protein